MSQFETICHSAGLKVTPQRRQIYQMLTEAKDHPSAEVLFQRVRGIFPNISLDTVNRTLLTLAQVGAAFIVEGSGDVKRFDGGLSPHQHFKCVKCRRIIDFHYEPFDNIELPDEIKGRFTVLRKTVYFEGMCKECGGSSK